VTLAVVRNAVRAVLATRGDVSPFPAVNAVSVGATTSSSLPLDSTASATMTASVVIGAAAVVVVIGAGGSVASASNDLRLRVIMPMGTVAAAAIAAAVVVVMGVGAVAAEIFAAPTSWGSGRVANAAGSGLSVGAPQTAAFSVGVKMLAKNRPPGADDEGLGSEGICCKRD
jgi:hypothetical protein